MLPVALRVNQPACQPQLATLGRLTGAAKSEDDRAAAEAFIGCIEGLISAVGIPRQLRELGVAQEQIPALVQGSHGNSLSGNPRDVNDEELHENLRAAW